MHLDVFTCSKESTKRLNPCVICAQKYKKLENKGKLSFKKLRISTKFANFAPAFP